LTEELIVLFFFAFLGGIGGGLTEGLQKALGVTPWEKSIGETNGTKWRTKAGLRLSLMEIAPK